MPWPSGELKHTLLVCVPVGPALWGVEVVSEWRLEEMGKAVVKWLCSDRQREKSRASGAIELNHQRALNKNKHVWKLANELNSARANELNWIVRGAQACSLLFFLPLPVSQSCQQPWCLAVKRGDKWVIRQKKLEWQGRLQVTEKQHIFNDRCCHPFLPSQPSTSATFPSASTLSLALFISEKRGLKTACVT